MDTTCIFRFPKNGDIGIAKHYKDITLTTSAAKAYNSFYFLIVSDLKSKKF